MGIATQLRSLCRQRWRSLSVIGGCLFCVLLLFRGCEHSARRALPWSAEDVHAYGSAYSGATMDYFYLLKARIDARQFEDYIVRMNLVPLGEIEERRSSHYVWGGFHAASGWWHPTESMSNTYHDPSTRGSMVVLAKYENGYLYFKESCGY